MGWKEKLFGTQPEKRGETVEPERPGRWGRVEDQTNETGRSIKDLFSVVTGGSGRPQRKCSEGHPVRRGQDTCIKGHYVGS